MMDFKAMVEADNLGVFLNAMEFADRHIVKYDGITYAGDDGTGIPVLLTKVKEMKRPVAASDHMQGIHLVTATAHIALSDLDGEIPEQKQEIQIDDGTALGEPFFRRYTIVTSDCEMGMVVLELEAFDE